MVELQVLHICWVSVHPLIRLMRVVCCHYNQILCQLVLQLEDPLPTVLSCCPLVH